MAVVGKYGKIDFSDDDIKFIEDNFKIMTNKKIADNLGLKPTRVRIKAYELGLKKIELEFWPVEAIQYLKSNFKSIGNKEIVKYFNSKYPKKKGWTTKHIDKKLSQLKLKRTLQDLYNIRERNRQNGSYGPPNPNKKAKLLKGFVMFKNEKYIIEPGQTKEEIFELIITNKIQPIKQIPMKIEQTEAFKSMSSLSQELVLKRINRINIEDQIIIARTIGLEKWKLQTGLQERWQKIVIEIIENE
ncbi:hypothetical protein [Flavobacterium sp. N1994]|uniref:hypothetical protein n=1 Tax=Flavobacterium sp. N1994 TaxID=2986827 RepID=UPI002223DDD1|nr:hypothetical protein [Flavobacterium sp. N1994]